MPNYYSLMNNSKKKKEKKKSVKITGPDFPALNKKCESYTLLKNE